MFILFLSLSFFLAFIRWSSFQFYKIYSAIFRDRKIIISFEFDDVFIRIERSAK